MSSRQLELPQWSRDLAARGVVTATIALPFEAPRQVEFDAGVSLAQMVEAAFDEGLIERAWDSALEIYIGDQKIPRQVWHRVKALPGRLVAIRALAQDPITGLLIDFAINAALAFAVNLVMSAFAPKPGNIEQAEQIYGLTNARNEIAPYRPISVTLGRHRIIPRQASKPFTRVVGEPASIVPGGGLWPPGGLPGGIGGYTPPSAGGQKVFLHLLLCLGIGPLALDEDSLKIGETPFSGFSGLTWQAKLKPTDPDPTIYPAVQPDEAEGAGYMTDETGWVSRTTDSDQCDIIEIENTYPHGLIRYKDSGDIGVQTVAHRIRYRKVGDTQWLRWGDDQPDDEGTLYTRAYKVPQPFRETFSKTVAERGQYEIAQKRVTPTDTYAGARERFEWSRIRSFTNEPPVDDPNMALLAIVAEAGEQLDGMIDQINCIVSRICPKWDADEEEFGAEDESSNVAELVRWMATGPCVKRPRQAGTEIDEAGFGAWAETCYTKGWRCDLEIRDGMPLDEAMALVASQGRAILGERAGKLTPILDIEQPAPTQLFTPRNSWGFRAQRRFPPEVHAYILEFNNEEKDFVPDEMPVYFPGYDFETAELLERVPVRGKTKPEDVFREGKRLIAEMIYRGEDYVWSADWESLTTERGRRAAISHYAVAVGRRSARVVSRIINPEDETRVVGVVLDEKIEQFEGDDYALAWRRVDGASITVEDIALATEPGVSNAVTFMADNGLPLADAPKKGDLVTFGDADIATLDVVLTNIARRPDLEAELSATAYTGELFDGDDAPEPEWQSNVSGEAFPAPPAPQIAGTAATAAGIFVDFDFPPNTAHRVRDIEAWLKRADDDGRFQLVGLLGADARLAVFPPGEAGVSYELFVAAIGERGQRRKSATVTVASATSLPPPALAFTPVSTSNMTVSGRRMVKSAPPAEPLLWDDDEPLLWDDGVDMLLDAEAWDGQVYSAEGFTGGATALGIVTATNRALMMGLSSAPAEAHYSSIDYAWRVGADGKLTIWMAGELAWDNEGDPLDANVNDVLSVGYDGADISFHVSGVLAHKIEAGPGLRFHFDSAFFSDDAALDGVTFSAGTAAGTVQETRYKRSFGPPAAPVGAEPEGWSLTRSDGEPGQGEYSSTVAKTLTGALAGTWSTPTLITSPNWRGAYNAATTYYREDAVSYAGGSYRLMVDTDVGHPPSGTQQDNSYWAVISQTSAPPPPGPPPGPYTATIALPSSSEGVNLYDLAVANGYTGHGDSDITFEVNSGVVIRGIPGAPNGGNAISTGSPPSGFAHDWTINFKNGSITEGGGGRGGKGADFLTGSTASVGEAGGKGGDALTCLMPLTVNIQAGAVLRAGGGGGGGGNSRYTRIGLVVTRSGGGGGGGAQPNGPGGLGGDGANHDGNPGQAGTTSARGAGGSVTAGEAGAFGGFYASAASAPGNAGAPGAPGFCIRMNGYDVTVTNNGTTAGEIA